MKKILSIIFVFLLILALKNTDAAIMEDYCQVPPYVIQNVAPNVMIVLDNSGSMFNLAYACPKAMTTAGGTNTVVPVKSENLAAFKRGLKILIGSTLVVVDSVDTINKTITVTASVTFSSDTLVQDYGCSGPYIYQTPSTSCPSTTTTAAGASVTIVPVNSTTDLWVGQIIVIVSGGVPYERVISAVSPSEKKVTVTQSVTFNSGSYVYDYSCYYFNNLYPEQSFYPSKEYYGYFNPQYWYTYTSSGGGKFIQSRLKTAGAKNADEWDGNFLNWLTMRRVDVVRKVMTGGTAVGGEGAGYDRLRGEKADFEGRGIYKAVSNAENYMGCTGCSGNMNFIFDTGTSNPSYFTAYSGNKSAGWTGRGSYNVNVRVQVPVEGVLQRVVGARARMGLSFYRTNEGGYVQVYVSGGSLSSTVNQINLTRPSTNTPLAETLWTMTGYFAQQASLEGGPGPRYASGDFQINNNVDPLNYGTGGQPAYRTCGKSFVLYITDGEPCSDGNLPSSILNYADGKSIFNCGVPNAADTCPAVSATLPGESFSFPASTFPTCPAGSNVAGIEDVALWMHTKDLRNKGGTPDIGVNNISGIQNLTLYTVFAFGKGSTLLRYASINGGFEDINGNNIPDLQSEWDSNKDGEPDTFYEATDGDELEQAIINAFLSILKRAASGTAASVLASGEGQGANLVQAVFYPRRRFGNDIIAWTGSLQNLWYHVDPFFVSSSIREETTVDNILNLTNDYIAQLTFSTSLQTTIAKLYADADGDGAPDSATPTEIKIFEDLGNLWEAGGLLWSRDISSTPRTIYTPCISGGACNLTTGMMNFATTEKTTLRPYLQASTDTEAEYIIRYLQGEGLTTVDLDDDGVNDILGVDLNSDTVDDYRARYAKIGSLKSVWKLGDILNSTPRIASWLQLNTYDSKYKDMTYNSFINTSDYKSRGMVFAGGNDGMLHAFKLGLLELSGAWKDSKTKKAKLTGSDLGKEIWAFTPKNALPYLKYMMDPDYCHIYTVDLPPYVFDASINGNSDDTKDVNSWRTIIIGGMRTGGACRGTSTACADVSGDGSKDCVNTPVDVDGSGVGFSSYFALDVTDQNNPKLLWEFSHPQLGFATTGPAVIRLGADKTKNGKWFVIFGSGPTGPISTTDWQFLARSDQDLRFFIFDLKTGPGNNNANVIVKNTNIQYAFAGSMLNSTNDSDLDYQDDAVYVGYTKRTSSAPYTWTDGGIGRLFTKEDINPSNWVWRTFRDGIGPVTSSIVKLQKNRGCSTTTATNEGCLWLFFGTGRYFYAQETGVDDMSGQRRLFGVKEPCVKSISNTMEIDPDKAGNCQNTVTGLPGGLTNVTSIGAVPSEETANSESFNGWYIDLEKCTDSSGTEVLCTASTVYYGTERTITDPLATTTGLLFFTTMKPYTDVCAIGGKSFIWAVRYNTGGAPKSALLQGVALLQVSTAAIEQIKLSEAFTQMGGRRTAAMEGLPPTQQGLSLMSQPPPVKRVIHMRER